LNRETLTENPRTAIGVADKSLGKPCGGGESYGKLQKSEAETEEGRAFNIAGRHSDFRSSLLPATDSIFRPAIFFPPQRRSSRPNRDPDQSLAEGMFLQLNARAESLNLRIRFVTALQNRTCSLEQRRL